MKKFGKIFIAVMCLVVAASAAFAAGNIGEARAKEIALAHANVKENEVRVFHIKTEMDHGQSLYDIEFYSGGKKYDYEIATSDGKILKYGVKVKSAPAQRANGQQKISPAEAKKIALAKVPGATEANIYKFKLDYDDGRSEYEGKIRYNNNKYEFEIDARSGEILKWEMDD
ncbi:MAG: PepSY domain-containing protein [Synergistaceae bacterium]|nr:PepSY domain-containing protein [Synergistaceae bacterium]